MAADADELCELPPPTPAPQDLCERAMGLVRSHPECFWFRHPEARIRHLEDVLLVVDHLREYSILVLQKWKNPLESKPEKFPIDYF